MVEFFLLSIQSLAYFPVRFRLRRKSRLFCVNRTSDTKYAHTVSGLGIYVVILVLFIEQESLHNEYIVLRKEVCDTMILMDEI